MSVGSDGTVGVSLTVVDPNGSALRFAMDGNFTPLLDSLPLSASQRASALASISAGESSPLLASLFGNRDGTVEPSEVGLFENLLRDQAGTVPSGTLAGGGVLSLTLDGRAPGSVSFDGVRFDGAPGPDTSRAEVAVTSSTTESFLPEGSSGTVVVAWNFTVASSLVLPAPNANLTVTTPAGTTIGTATGLQGERTRNDPFGYGPASATGSVGPSSTGSATVGFHPSFPLGNVLIAAAVAAAGAAAVWVLWRRRRRAREAEDADRA